MSGMTSPVPTLWQRSNATGIPLLLARILLGGVMVIYSLPKIQQPVTFLKMIHEYHLVPDSWPMVLNAMAVVIPWIELMGGVLLILGALLRGTGLTFLMMLIFFTGAIVLRTLHILQTTGIPFLQIRFDCGCGLGAEIIWIKLLKNLGLMLLSLWVLVSKHHRYCLTLGSDRRSTISY